MILNLDKTINDLILNLEWKVLENKSRKSFLDGIQELIENGELTEKVNDYEITLQSKALNVIDVVNGLPTLMLTYSILQEEEEIGYYKFVAGLDLIGIDDYLVIY